MKKVKENLIQYQFNLENDLNTLKSCELQLVQDKNYENDQIKYKVKQQILEVTQSLINEIKFIRKYYNKVENKSQLEDSDQEEYNMITLKYNKLMIMAEKIYSCVPEFTEVIMKLNQNKQQQSSQMQTTEEKNFQKQYSPESQINYQNYKQDTFQKNFSENTSPFKQQISQQQDYEVNNCKNNLYESNFQSSPFKQKQKNKYQQLNNNHHQNINQKQGSPQQHSPLSRLNQNSFNQGYNVNKQGQQCERLNRQASFPDMNSINFIKKELVNIKNTLQECKKQIDIHDHTDYEQEIEQIKINNRKILQDYQILKQDNTEILHSVQQLNKISAEVMKQNQYIFQQIQRLSMQNKEKEQQQNVASSLYQQSKEDSQYDSQQNDRKLLTKNQIQDEELLASWARKKLGNN